MMRFALNFAALAVPAFYALPSWASEPHEGGSKTLPQLDVGLFPGVLFWMITVFVLFFILMKKIGVPAVQETVANRRSVLDGDLDAARRASNEAQAVIKAHEESLYEARRKAHETVGNIVAQAAREAAEEQDRQNQDLHHRMIVAQENLATAKQKAMRETQNFVNDLVQEIVAKVMESGIEAKANGARK